MCVCALRHTGRKIHDIERPRSTCVKQECFSCAGWAGCLCDSRKKDQNMAAHPSLLLEPFGFYYITTSPKRPCAAGTSRASPFPRYRPFEDFGPSERNHRSISVYYYKQAWIAFSGGTKWQRRATKPGAQRDEAKYM